jgi:hypothetical protein
LASDHFAAGRFEIFRGWRNAAAVGVHILQSYHSECAAANARRGLRDGAEQNCFCPLCSIRFQGT